MVCVSWLSLEVEALEAQHFLQEDLNRSVKREYFQESVRKVKVLSP